MRYAMPIPQAEKVVPESQGGGGGAELPVGAVRITTGKAYIGNEIYCLQRGDNRRVIAVTQGTKCTQIYSETESESEAAAAAAILRGLEEPWDIEYDLYRPAGYSISGLGGVSLEGGYTSVEVDYGDGSAVYKGSTVPGSHTYASAGVYHVRVRTDAKTVSLNLGDYWDWLKNSNVRRFNEGISVYVGGSVENVKGSSQQVYVGRLTFGESVVKLANLNGIGSGLGREQFDIGLPPNFVSPVSGYTAVYSGSPINYLYIPESCTVITDHAFGEMALKNVEIEPKGETLVLLGFNFAAASSNWAEVPIVEIPARIQLPPTMYQGKIFNGCGVRLVRFESGMTAIPAYCLYGANHTDGLSVSGVEVIASGNKPMRVFIPKTVTGIASNVFSTGVGIVYEGSQSEWDNISRSSSWCSGNDSDCTFQFCGSLSKYRAVWEAEKSKYASSSSKTEIGRGLTRAAYNEGIEVDTGYGLTFEDNGSVRIADSYTSDILSRFKLHFHSNRFFPEYTLQEQDALYQHLVYVSDSRPLLVIITEDKAVNDYDTTKPDFGHIRTWVSGSKSSTDYSDINDDPIRIRYQESRWWVYFYGTVIDEIGYDKYYRYYIIEA